ncbi:C-Jun-amino-terminal kinase-interacting protein 4 isoform X1 [Salmo salar]|uniref:C-Jun-amino-terminal kinase-interacting protein 4 n=2 Tax=Salmo TaxID=8028 RepID=A0A1S3SF56_SALSA|nr:C-Jun-amino-terminal kinase-interacting protein 4-like isoform X1 [Salmo salar]|eukprot:XP_014062953.1 PREDICTED: C-Jun-amino-terminal kinase-interacting protein 4-like isoform X1 [Salmo salar]
MELDDGVLYQDDSGSSAMMSERVSGLASSIYREFERLICQYDEDVVKELMPLVVAVLENLDAVFADNQEHEVELELLKEDNEQLVTQYEREKSLRKSTEERYMVFEDSQDMEKKDLQGRLVMLESHTRQMELKTRNYSDQIGRMEEREAELKKEYNALHQRHTEMIHSYMEHLERTKHQQETPSDTSTSRSRKERPISMGLFQLPGSDLTPDPQRETVETPSESWRYNDLSHPHSNTSLKLGAPDSPSRWQRHSANQQAEQNQDEMSNANRGGSKSNPPMSPKGGSKSGTPMSSQGGGSKMSSQQGGSKSATLMSSQGESKSGTPISSQGVDSKSVTSMSTQSGGSKSVTPMSSQGGGSMSATPMSTSASDVAMASVGTPHQEELEEVCEGLNRNLDRSDRKPENISSKNTTVHEGQDSELRGAGVRGGSEPLTDAADDNTESSEVQSIIESTPELDMDLSGYKDASTPSKGVGIENMAFDRNTESLFAELSSAGPDMEVDIADMDEGADLLGMGREVEHLIHENTQLLETKNALNVVKNDLIARVDELSCEKEALQGELEAVTQAKTRLEEKNKELEEELRRIRVAEKDKVKTKSENSEEDADVPTAQRKRFTRVEMARVLMERNQYKERLMELQEAVRWTEMIRASRENPAAADKKKSSIWQFFSRLFSSSGGAAKKPAEAAPVNVKYNAPSSQVQPSVKKKSAALQQLPSDKSKAFDFLNEESEAGNMVSRREQKRAQYRQVKAHVEKEEDGRVQAYGWSLPQKFKVANGGQTSENKMKNLPVPVYLRPLDEKDATMKLWCAVGVNLSGGKTRDGGSIVGASVFYSDLTSPGPESRRRKVGSQSSLDKLDQDLKEQEKELHHQEELSSLVWICTSTQATTKVIVIDANQPGNVLENFFVCNSHVLCMASVPGARETDYPAGEEVPHNPEAGSGAEGGTLEASTTSSGSGGEAGVLAGINVVGCSTEGAVATPQTASTENETDADSKAAEEATEATEASAGPAGPEHDLSQRGVYTEHVFTDPLGVQSTSPGKSPANYTQRESDLVKDGVSSNPNPEEQDLMREEAQKMSSVLPTMWLGAQNGCVYVHSSVAQWRKCLHSIKLKDSVLGIVHVKGRVLVSLADGTLAIFHRGVDGQWDLTNYHLLDLGRPHHSIRCMTVVHDKVWCGFRNKIYVVQPKAMKIEKSFDAHPRKESQVRQLAWDGDGIWVSIRLDSTLRLFHAHTHQHLQDVDIEPYVSKMLGTGKLGFSFVRITALMVSCNRLWVGTGNGVIISIPLTDTNKVTAGPGKPGGVIRVYGDENSDKVTAGTSVPFCSMAHAQLCFHGHRDAVKFFTAVPGQVIPSGAGGAAEVGSDKGVEEHPQQQQERSVLVMSGGEGYIDFRMGDEAGETEEPLDEHTLKLQPFLAKAERSHLIVWQVMGSQA